MTTTTEHLVDERYNKLLNDPVRVCAAIPEADEAGEDIGDYLYKVAQSEID